MCLAARLPLVSPSRTSAAAVAVLLFVLMPLDLSTAVAQARDAPAEDMNQNGMDKPVSNGVFADVIIRARITQRFEIYNPHSQEQLQDVKNMGFTQVILDWPNLHAAAGEIGLAVVLANWWTLETDDQEIEKGIDTAKRVDPRRLVGVSMMDEPERYAPDTPFSFYQALYYDLRAQFDQELPGVKLEVSHWGPLASWTPRQYETFIPLYQATDRIRLMPYPDLHEGPLAEVYYQMIRSRHLMKLAGRDLPQVVILQTWVLPEKPQLPRIEELRVMAYSAILCGADTLSFYSYDPELWRQTAGFTAGFADLMQELTEFSRQHSEATVEARMSGTGVLTATITPAQGEPLSMLVNTNRTSVDGLAGLEVVMDKSYQKPSFQSCAGRSVAPRRQQLFRFRRLRCRPN